MGRFIVSTLPDVNKVAAFVTSSEGVPEPGLELANFRVRMEAPGTDGALLMVVDVASSNLAGFYILNLQAAPAETRRKGLYVFDLIVEKDDRQGQTVSSVIMT
jgi:hypothetical protein